MITNWRKFEEWRKKSLEYHERYGMDSYTRYNALSYFEYAREYFGKFGFPVQTEKYKNGKLKPWSKKQEKEQKEAILNYIAKRKVSK